jgi:hypothetical protein
MKPRQGPLRLNQNGHPMRVTTSDGSAMGLSRRIRRAACASSSCLVSVSFRAQEKPLPDLDSVLKGLRKHCIAIACC